VSCIYSTYNGGKEATCAEHFECHGDGECSKEENDRQQEYIRHGAGDVRIIAGVTGQAPAMLQTLLFSHTDPTYFNALTA